MIEFRHVTKRYSAATPRLRARANAAPTNPAPKPLTENAATTSTQLPAVDDFTLTVPAGAITVLLGSSGCGKTTLLRMVNRMVEPSSGHILLGGEDVASAHPVLLRRRIGYVLQNAGLLPHLRVVDNVATVPRLLGATKAEARRRALEMLDLVGLDHRFASRWPAQLSDGQRQRVGVARALAARPRTLLMDEPFGAVDPLQRAELQRLLLDIHAELGTTTLFVTHDVDEAFLLGHLIVLLRQGARIAQIGTPAEIFANPADEFVAGFVGAHRTERRLHLTTEGGTRIVLDGAGRPVGYLPDDGAHRLGDQRRAPP